MHTIFIHQPYLDDDPIIIETTPELLYELKIEKLISNNSYIGTSNCNLNELNKIYLVDCKNNEYFSDVEIFDLSLDIDYKLQELNYDDYQPSNHKYSSNFIYDFLNKSPQEQFNPHEKLKYIIDLLGEDTKEKYKDHTHIFLKANVMLEFNKFHIADIIYNPNGTISIYNGEHYNDSKFYEINNLYFEQYNVNKTFTPYIYQFQNNPINIIFSQTNLHKSTVNTLNNNGFIDTNSLAKIDKYDLFRIPKLGRKSIKNIISICRENNINFMEKTFLLNTKEYQYIEDVFYPDFNEE
jgi:hypothetical protein